MEDRDLAKKVDMVVLVLVREPVIRRRRLLPTFDACVLRAVVPGHAAVQRHGHGRAVVHAAHPGQVDALRAVVSGHAAVRWHGHGCVVVHAAHPVQVDVLRAVVPGHAAVRRHGHGRAAVHAAYPLQVKITICMPIGLSVTSSFYLQRVCGCHPLHPRVPDLARHLPDGHRPELEGGGLYELQ